ncbi:hypothetical protein [aff. Roholtiella sp. LEGE 12411]|uniref:hypothetical protein n=1 Tax=aff. Roholtiella sp. LEGE 12411 TaxID=1828822 RepID=UPI0018829BE8|nr:hypothetical protein [aff. Roholtiella sp. LEGE 12411]
MSFFIGHGAMGMGHWALGMGQWALGTRGRVIRRRRYRKEEFSPCSLPKSFFPMPNVPFSVPNP